MWTWTLRHMNRVGVLKDRPYTGRYRVKESRPPSLGFTISRADVADFMIKAVENRSSIGKIVGVSS